MTSRHSTLAIAAAIAACSSPPPPEIPPRDVIGPPREAAAECKPPTRMFAQDYFIAADLDSGTSCMAFVEQDECVIAIFRDCTDHESQPPRSWQGAIDSNQEIELFRTREAAGSINPRSPISCEGDLQSPEGEPVWAKLSCRISGGSGQEPHRGFYLERVPGPAGPFVPGLGTLDPPIIVAQPPSPIEDYVSDLAVLPGKGELWAIVNAPGSDPASGLYTGRAATGALSRVPGVPAVDGTRLTVSSDERYVVIADGRTFHRVDTTSMQVLPGEVMGEVIRDVATLDAGLLIATLVTPRPNAATRLTLRRFDDLTDLATSTVAGELAEILPLPSGPHAAFLRFTAEPTVVRIDSQLRLSGDPIDLGAPVVAAVYASGRDALAYALSVDARFGVYNLATTRRYEMRLTSSGEVAALGYDPDAERVLVAMQGGMLTGLDLVGERPLMQSQLDLGASVSRIRRDPTSGVIYALRGAVGLIDPLTP